VIHFHGGFWAAGTKEASQMYLIPWFEMGWNVVNVEYRLAHVALAPAYCDSLPRKPRLITLT
jgi:acetyl esterase/lipase